MFNLLKLLTNFQVCSKICCLLSQCACIYMNFESQYTYSVPWEIQTTHWGWWGIPKQGLTMKRPWKSRDSVSAFRKGHSQRAFFFRSWGNWLQMSQYVVVLTVVMSVLQLTKINLTVIPNISFWFYRFSARWLYIEWIAQIC